MKASGSMRPGRLFDALGTGLFVSNEVQSVQNQPVPLALLLMGGSCLIRLTF